jgi:hypothetical protein
MPTDNATLKKTLAELREHPARSSLCVRGSRLARLAVDSQWNASTNKAGRIFKTLLFADNTLDVGENQFLAQDIALTGNHFEADTGSDQGVPIGYLVGNAATLAGNLCPNPKAEMRVVVPSGNVRESANLMTLVP